MPLGRTADGAWSIDGTALVADEVIYVERRRFLVGRDVQSVYLPSGATAVPAHARGSRAHAPIQFDRLLALGLDVTRERPHAEELDIDALLRRL